MKAKDQAIRVLLVDENREDYHLIVDLLSSSPTPGFSVNWIRERDEALDALGRGEFDILLLDARFSLSIDWDHIGKSSAQVRSMPIIILAEGSSHAAVTHQIPAETAACLLKTEISAALLERSILSAIERKGLRQGNSQIESNVQRAAQEHPRSHGLQEPSRTFFRLAMDALPDNIAILDSEGFILCTNQSWKVFAQSNGLFDYSFEGVNYLDICANATGDWAEEAPVVAAAIRDMLANGKTLFELEYPCHSPEAKRWFLLRAAVFRQDSEVRVVVSHVNITERVLAQEALVSQRAKTQLVLDNIPAGVALVEQQAEQLLRLVLANDLAERILGRPIPFELSTKELSDYFKAYRAGTREPYPVDENPLVRAMSGESVNVDDLEIMHSDGSRIRLDLTGVAVLDTAPKPASALVIFQDITKRKHAEDNLRQSEQRFRELAENIHEVFWIRTDQETLYVNSAYEDIWGRTCEGLYKNPLSLMESVHPQDREDLWRSGLCTCQRRDPFEVEYRIIRPDGSVRWIYTRCSPILEQGRVIRTVASSEDITIRKEAEEFLLIERDLAIGVESSKSLLEALELLLDAGLRVNGLDCGGIYLLDSETGLLTLAYSRGLSDSFVQQASVYEASSPQGIFVMRGKPGYWSNPAGILETGDLLAREGLMSLAVIPVSSQGQIVATLNLGSHVKKEILQSVRHFLETIAAYIGRALTRVRLTEDLKNQSERLQEVNTALKVLLDQRQQDRSDFESSLLGNVKHLILPYIEKLKRSRLDEGQSLYLAILESHLGEIMSPFLRRLSSDFIGFTMTEMHVAELIRQGKTSKEIAELVGTSERAVHFHRQNIRGKLGLKQKKTNLRSHLSSIRNRQV